MSKKQKFTDLFGIPKSARVSFFDIPILSDIEAFLCPFLISNSSEDKVSKSVYERMKRFLEVLNNDFIKKNDRRAGLSFLSHLHEPNEYHFGYSDTNKGKAVSKLKAEVIFDSLRSNKLAKQGSSITNEAQNVLLLVKGIGQDNMSDIMANVCRDIFSKYTEKQCVKYSIPLNKKEIEFYNPKTNAWEVMDVKLPEFGKKSIILVPKKVVSGGRHYAGHYNRFVVSNYIAADILDGKLNPKGRDKMIATMKNGTRKAIIKKIYETYKRPKQELIEFVFNYQGSLLAFQLYAKEHYPELDLSDL